MIQNLFRTCCSLPMNTWEDSDGMALCCTLCGLLLRPEQEPSLSELHEWVTTQMISSLGIDGQFFRP